MFKACMPVIRCDIQSARFLMPYLLQCVISTGSSDSRKGDPTPYPTPFLCLTHLRPSFKSELMLSFSSWEVAQELWD